MFEVVYDPAGVQALLTVEGRLEGFRQQFLDEAAKLLIQLIREEAPKRSGKLRESVRILDKGVDYVSVGPTAPYAIFVELGTRPHEILPRRAQALRFWIEGEIVFAKRVMHPGFPPRGYMRAAYLRARDELVRLAEGMLKQALGG